MRGGGETICGVGATVRGAISGGAVTRGVVGAGVVTGAASATGPRKSRPVGGGVGVGSDGVVPDPLKRPSRRGEITLGVPACRASPDSGAGRETTGARGVVLSGIKTP